MLGVLRKPQVLAGWLTGQGLKHRCHGHSSLLLIPGQLDGGRCWYQLSQVPGSQSRFPFYNEDLPLYHLQHGDHKFPNTWISESHFLKMYLHTCFLSFQECNEKYSLSKGGGGEEALPVDWGKEERSGTLVTKSTALNPNREVTTRSSSNEAKPLLQVVISISEPGDWAECQPTLKGMITSCCLMLKGIISFCRSAWSVINSMHCTQKWGTQNSGKWNSAIYYFLLWSKCPGAHCQQTKGMHSLFSTQKRTHWRKMWLYFQWRGPMSEKEPTELSHLKI